MGGSLFAARLSLAGMAVVGAAILAVPEAKAITYGMPDCTDFDDSTSCEHPNTVSLSGFRPATASDETDETLVSFVRCSGSLLSKDADRFVILTAGHCASAYLSGLQDESIRFVGVSFDPKIDKDVSETTWSPKQYILGGRPVLPVEYGPQGANASNIQFDYAVVVFELDETQRYLDGAVLPDSNVDLSGINPVELPGVNYLPALVSAPDPLLLTAVGYGTGEAHAKPGDPVDHDGAVNSVEEFGERWMTDLTAAFSFMGPEQNLLLGSQNPARGHEGTCGGDSGGPLFYLDDDGVEIQVAITSSGDAICRATSIMARTDSARAVDFLSCVRTSADLDEIEQCG